MKAALVANYVLAYNLSRNFGLKPLIYSRERTRAFWYGTNGVSSQYATTVSNRTCNEVPEGNRSLNYGIVSQRSGTPWTDTGLRTITRLQR